MKFLVLFSILTVFSTKVLYSENVILPRVVSDTQKYLAFIDVIKGTDNFSYHILFKTKTSEDKQVTFTLPVLCDVFYLTDRCIFFTDNFMDESTPRIYVLILKNNTIFEFNPKIILDRNKTVNFTISKTNCNKSISPWHFQHFNKVGENGIMLQCGDVSHYRPCSGPYWIFNIDKQQAFWSFPKGNEREIIPDFPIHSYIIQK